MRTATVAVAALLGLLGCRRQAPPSPPPSPPVAAPTVSGDAALPLPFRPSSWPRIDVHTHVSPDAVGRAVELLGARGIVHFANLSGGWPGRGLDEQIAAARAFPGRVTLFCTPDFREVLRGPGYGKRMAEQLAQAKARGAVGMKLSKGLGLGYEDASGKLLPVDDPGLDPLFAKAGELGMPVAIHTGDPMAFWQPPTPVNERYDELVVHPGWSFYGATATDGSPVPSWEQLFAAFERRVARHPKTTFIGVHFGNAPEDPDRVARLLDKYPNLVIDTAARVPEIGRRNPGHAVDKMKRFFERYQDRILFGTDAGIGPDPADLMLGSTGAEPPTAAEIERFWSATWRYFETADRDFVHPTPIQGRWTIDGVALPPAILEKVYYKNAMRLLGLKELPAPPRMP